MSTNIEWTNETWNPIIGCSKISEGCENCYAEKMAHRLNCIELKKHGLTSEKRQYKNVMYKGKWNGVSHLVQSALQKPTKWKNPRMIFVCSMGDLFHETMPFEYINAVYSIMSDADQHTYQVLTKRPERMLEFFNWKSSQHGVKWQPKDNIWHGVSIENQLQAIIRIPFLLDIHAKVRFVSCEPLLGAVDLTRIKAGVQLGLNALNGESYSLGKTYLDINNRKINWVICGGESGHKARPMHPDWVKSLQKQCETANVPFFFKQWGEWISHPFNKHYKAKNIGHYYKRARSVDDFDYGSICNPEHYKNVNANMSKVGKKKAGCLLDGKEYKQFPNY